jgi:hypothetical protein
LLRLLGAFGLSLALWYGLRYPYTRVTVRGGAHILSGFAGVPADELLLERQGRFLLDTQLRRGGKRDVRELDAYPVTWNAVFLLTLALCTPWRRLERFWPYILCAAGLLWLTQVLFFCLATHAQVARIYEVEGMQFQSSRATRALAMAVQGYGVTLSLAVPFLLYAPVFLLKERKTPARRRLWGTIRRALRALRGALGRTASRRRLGKGGKPPGRNSPCPCGSGRKYKRCCG